jgi:hypothetical protein
MGKRIKKPPVRPEQRQDWLKRYELGETPPKIAEADGFDVRTVRRQIEHARLERDVREARAGVLRDALESHYRDMYDRVIELDAEISSENTVSLDAESDRKLSALRQHLPRSPLWNNLRRRNEALNKISELENSVKEQFAERLARDESVEEILIVQPDFHVSNIVAAMLFQFKAWARGWSGLNIDTDVHIDSRQEGYVDMRYGAFHVWVLETYIEKVRQILQDYESEIRDWEQYEDMQKQFRQFESLSRRLRDDLAVIIMRRIVPGRCKYCPI